jgi:hypothetical protein
MSATNQFEDDLLDLIFTNVAAPNVGDAGGLQPSAAPGSAQISLHTNAGAVDDTHTLTTQFEAAYTNYARQLVARSVAGWTVATGTVDNDAPITFPQSGSGPETEDQFGITLQGTGDVLQIYGAITTPLVVNNGITPEFAIGDLDISID